MQAPRRRYIPAGGIAPGRRRLELKTLSIALALALPVLAGAETETPSPLDEVIVTAPPMSETLVVITDPKAPRQPVPAHDGADYLKNIPGFSVIRKGGTDGDPVLRGLAGSRLNVLMDGQYILGGCGMRMDPPTAYVFPESYDRITVLKGPQTVLYGGGNLAGTVLFERETPPFETAGMRAFAGALAGSFGRRDVVADVTAGGAPGFVRAIGTRSRSDDYEDGDGTRVHSAYERWSGSLIAGWTPDKDTRIEITADRSDGEAAYADRGMDGTVFDRQGYGVKARRNNLSPLFASLEAQVYHNYVDHVMDNFTLRDKPAMMPYQVSNPDRTTDGARVSAGLALSANTVATFGLDYQKNEHTLRQASSAVAPPDIDTFQRVPDMTFENIGVFAELEHELGAKSRVVGGLRADRLEVENERTTGPGALATTTDRTRAGFARYEREIATGLSGFAGLGHAERAADWWERSTFNAFFLDPEKTNQLDAGLVYAAGAWRGSLSLFYARIDDYILTRAVGSGMMAMRSARNIDARMVGGEGDVSYAFARRWKATATIAWVRGENETDDVPLAQMPPLEGTLGVQYDDGTWLFGALARMVDSQDRVHETFGNIAGQDIEPTPGFSMFSLNGGYRPSKKVLVTAGIDNLLDKTYAEHLSRSGTAIPGYEQIARVNEPGRNVWLKASITLD